MSWARFNAIAAFAATRRATEEGPPAAGYYPVQSVGIACGMLITAIHTAGLVCLPYTPSPPGFLNDILARPPDETPLLILVTGYPAADATVPALTRKPLTEIATFV